MKSPRTISILAFVLTLFNLTSNAQQAPAPPATQELPPAYLSVISLGPKPIRRFGSDSDTGGAAVLLPPKPGEIPPSQLYHKSSKKQAGSTSSRNNGWASINATFNNPNLFCEVPFNQTIDLHRRADSSGEASYKPYLSLAPLAPGSRTLVLLLPNGKGDKLWVPKPTVIQLDLNSDRYRDKNLIILNLSRQTVANRFDTETKILPPGETLTMTKDGDKKLFRIAAIYGKAKTFIMDTAIRLQKGQHKYIYAFYDANPHTNDRRSVGVLRFTVDSGQQ